MPTARAFRALRYTSRAGDIRDLVAPPYDVMSRDERNAFAARSEHNVVRLTLPLQGPPSTVGPINAAAVGDAACDVRRYEHAARLLSDWLASGALAVEDEPSMTVVRETFTVEGIEHRRTGVEVAVRLESYGEGAIFPHERTLAAPKADRLALMRATKAQFGPVFVLVPDEEGDLRACVARASSRQPDHELAGPDEATRRVWVERDGSRLAALERALAGRPAVIADGHHRYETALAYRDELAAAGGDPGEAGFVLAHVVPIGDPGLVVLPTHRVVQPTTRPDEKAFLARVGEAFELEKITQGAAAEFARRSPADGDPQRFVVGAGRPARFHLARLRDASAMAARAPDRSEAWRALDVPCLHLLVLDDVLGITPGEVTAGKQVSYTHDVAKVVAAVEHEGALGFILRPTPPEAVSAVARSGERMPQKSTYFYPKVAAGFAMRLLA